MKSLHFILLFSLSAFGLQAQQAFSLEEAVQYALQNSNQVRLAQLESINAEASIQEIRTAAIPKVSAGLDYQHNIIIPQFLLPGQAAGMPEGTFIAVEAGLKNNLTGNVSASALLFDPTVFVGIQAAQLYRDLVSKEMNQTTFELRYNVEKAYLAVLIAEKNLDIIEDNISNLQKTLRETAAIYEEGFAEKLDVDRLTLSLENLKTQAENTAQFVALNYNLLKFQMGYPIKEEIVLTNDIDNLVSTTLVDDQVLLGTEFQLEQRPEYATIKAGEALNIKNIASKKAARYPSLLANGAYQQSLQRNNLFDENELPWIDLSFVGVSLKVPIFNGFTTKYQIQQAEVDLRKTQVQLNDFERAATLEYQNARIAYFNAKRTVNANKRSQELAERIYETTQIKYREGVGSSLEVTQAESELYQAQGNYINSLYDLLVAKTDLEKALGQN
ncbi:MAG: TolC family protein [Bacteroidota bacterium]